MACRNPTLTLIFSGTNIGAQIIAHTSKPLRLTEVHRRQNYWSPQIILDGRYPAVMWEHDFTVYNEAGDIFTYVGSFYGLGNMFYANPSPLVVNYLTYPMTVSAPKIYLGDCYLDNSPEQDNPDSLLLHKAGFFKTRFLGTVIPSIIT